MRYILVLLIFLTTSISFGQSELLAKNYFNQGNYEKAISLYQSLLKQNPGRLDYFLTLVKAHQQLENYQEAETLLKDKLNARRINPQFYVELGHNLDLQGKNDLAKAYYDNAVTAIEEIPAYAYTVGRVFEQYSLLNYAIRVYELAMQIDEKKDFNTQLARIYGEQGKLEKMFNAYLDIILKRPEYKNAAQRNFSFYITEDPNNEANKIFKKTLLTKSQEQPNLLFNNLLSWLFVQQKEYKKAFIQEKAIYKRTQGNLTGIVELSLLAIEDKAYDDASQIVNFIIENAILPEAKIQGHHYAMKIKMAQATPKDYERIEKDFKELFNTYGDGRSTYLLQIEYNHFLAFTLSKTDESIANLKKLSSRKMNPHQKARVKMELADILVKTEKFNEALIYYTQIQTQVQNDVLAQEARYKVAQTSYFKGDFTWALVQLDVLKKSTSQLIANDAMHLSLMIRDNSLEDSTQTALKKYARAEILALQNKIPEALTLLDDVLTQHKGESIEDEALFKQASLYKQTANYTKAESLYLKLISLFGDDILADDAYFELAQLYEKHLEQPEKAKQYYEQIIYNYQDSIYFVDARKNYRSLRGDAIPQ